MKTVEANPEEVEAGCRGVPGNAPPICKYKMSREEECPKKVTSLGSLMWNCWSFWIDSLNCWWFVLFAC